MKRWIWLALMIAAVLFSLLWNWRSPLSSPPAAQLVQATTPTINFPTVDAPRLLADLESLSFPRHEESDRIKARRYIRKTLTDAGWEVQRIPFEDDAGNSGVNLLATRPGSDANAGTILLGAHYDTVARSPGADDNATSVATVLEAARLLSATTPHTLELAFFDLEEAGLLGSQAFVADLPQPDQIKGAVILDMVGYACRTAGCQTYPSMLPVKPPTDRGEFLAVIGDQGHSALIDSFARSTRPTLPPMLTLAIPTLGDFTPDLVRSDHAPFWKKGIGALLITDTANFRNPNYHQSSDTLDSLDREFFLGSAQGIVNGVTTLLQERD
jgi:hypothetical protein